jgi:magnesium-transporting ATPase (P-type)
MEQDSERNEKKKNNVSQQNFHTYNGQSLSHSMS